MAFEWNVAGEKRRTEQGQDVIVSFGAAPAANSVVSADQPTEDQGRVSLHPLNPEDALKALLRVDPDSEPES